MSEFTHDLNPVDQIIADAVGEPGKRTFFLQGRAGREVVSLVLEKQEVKNWKGSIPTCRRRRGLKRCSFLTNRLNRPFVSAS